jgi:hypothetical protein
MSQSQTFTSWWIDNYVGWGQFRSPPTGPMPTTKQDEKEADDEAARL